MGGADQTLDRSFEYDHSGRLTWAYTGPEATAHAVSGQWGQGGGPYAHAYFYDAWGNVTRRLGWGGWNASASYSYQGNRNTALQYDLSGNVTADGAQMAYDATGQQVSSFSSGGWGVGSAYDGDRLRVRREENGQTTYYVRSSVLGGQVVAEVNAAGWWVRGHVYLGGQALAVQEGGAVWWVHEDPVTKTKKRTDASGTVTSTTLVDPWGGEVAGVWVQSPRRQRKKFTTYERGADNRDEAQQRSYHAWFSRFDQPDPYEGSYDLSDPQSFNRYAYVNNDPVNFVDPSGLNAASPGIGGGGYCYFVSWVDDGRSRLVGVHCTSGGGGGGGGGAQNPAQRPLTAGELATIRNELANMLANDKCRAFIDKLVSLNTGRAFDSRSLLGYFDNTVKSAEGGVFFAPGNGGINRQRREDYAKVFIGAEPRAGILPSAVQANLRAGAQTAMHEFIHAVTVGSDDRLSADIQQLGIVPIYNGKPLSPPTGQRDGKPFNDYSGYWNSALGNACFPQGVYKP